MDGRIYERMYRFVVAQFIIRVWAKPDASRERIQQIVGQVVATSDETMEIATAVANLCPEINAVEVLVHGEGSLAYNDWP